MMTRDGLDRRIDEAKGRTEGASVARLGADGRSMRKSELLLDRRDGPYRLRQTPGGKLILTK